MPERFVAYADVLGFRPLVMASEHDSLAKRYDDFLVAAESGVSHGRWFLGNDGMVHSDTDLATVNMLAVSDSIFLWTDETRAPEFASLVIAVGKMLVAGFAMGIPLRAGIALGNLSYVVRQYRNRRLAATPLFGDGLVRAYELEEAQVWSGGVVSDEAFRAYEASLRESPGIETLKGPITTGPLVEYSVPLKTGREELTAISWPRFNRSGVTAEMVTKSFTMHGKTLDKGAETKLENTLAFLEATHPPG